MLFNIFFFLVGVMITYVMEIVVVADWQDTSVFGSWVDVAWCEGWEVSLAACLPRL